MASLSFKKVLSVPGEHFNVVLVVSVDLRFRLLFHINCIDDLSL